MAMLATQQSDAIRLAGEPPFCLGSLAVTPALRQVMWNGESRTIEPRVMQVLVALAREPGAIVSRDSLVERCWEGRIVGENAIQRVISLLRHLAAASGAFEVETITKVGYRLKIQDAPRTAPTAVAPAESAPQPRPTRRDVLIGAGAALAGSAGLAWLVLPSAARREAQRLHAAGLAIQRRDSSSGLSQAVSFFERAAAADPSFAPAWADLAYARFELLDYMAEDEQEPTMAQIRHAAGRALSLDPGNRQAVLTLALIRPNFRNRIVVHREVGAALRRLPNEPQLHERMGVLHMDTGRMRAAEAEFRWLVAREPLVPGHQVQLARAIWYGGDPPRAGALLGRARQLWPVNPRVWLAEFDFRLLTGRARAALAMTEASTLGLGGQSPLSPDVGIATARALASGDAADRNEAVRTIVAARQRNRVGSFIVIPYLVALGATEEAWQAVYTYHFGRRDPTSGERLPLPAIAWRRTDILYAPATASLRGDPRFPKLTAALGLDAYWRATGTRPDIA
jgi:DNA-binding winged helix-turn-helix (wHTH) protein